MAMQNGLKGCMSLIVKAQSYRNETNTKLEWSMDIIDFCSLCKGTEETMDGFLCHFPCLQVHRQRWLDSRFTAEMVFLTDCNLEGS